LLTLTGEMQDWDGGHAGQKFYVLGEGVIFWNKSPEFGVKFGIVGAIMSFIYF